MRPIERRHRICTAGVLGVHRRIDPHTQVCLNRSELRIRAGTRDRIPFIVDGVRRKGLGRSAEARRDSKRVVTELADDPHVPMAVVIGQSQTSAACGPG